MPRSAGRRSWARCWEGARAATPCPAGGLDPDGGGTEVAITAALEEAGLAPAAVGHVNAHGSASRVSDLAEARAFRANLRPAAACPSRP